MSATQSKECQWTRQGETIACGDCGFSLRWPPHKPPLRRICGAPARAKPAAAPPDTSCVHRGEVLRTEKCPSCRNSTIDVSVFGCALHGECTLHDYARKNPNLAAAKVCAACPDRKLAQPKLPSLAARAAKYGKAWIVDRATGKRRRPSDLVEQIFQNHCLRCPRYNADESACAECGCFVSADGREDNKIAWANESCPLGKWPIQTANLIYYILPLKHPHQVWQWHVEQLRQRIDLFNGRRIVTIATRGPGNYLALDDAAEVRKAFGTDADSIEFLERPNDPQHWETPAFREMLGRIREAWTVDRGPNADTVHGPRSTPHAPSSATFYFHAKGVRRARQEAIRPWCEAIYRHNLDRWAEVKEILCGWPCCGIAKIPANPTSWPEGGNWHFAGTGFWFRDDALFSRPNWQTVHDHSHAVEGYLSTQFDAGEAYCLAYQDVGQVYAAHTWHDPAAEARATSPRPSVSVLVVSRNYGRYLDQCLKSVLAQTVRPKEILYVDDGSDDDSVAVARALVEAGAPIKIFAHPQRQGAAAARNRAAAYSTGEALLFVDGDNHLPADYLEKMLRRLTPATPFVYPDLARFGDVEEYHRVPEFDADQLARGNFCDTCSLMWRDCFERAGGWKDSWMGFDDWHLMLRLSKLGRPARADVALHYRVHGESVTANMLRQLDDPNWADLVRRLVADALGDERAAQIAASIPRAERVAGRLA